jgi:hypothetical protein
MKKALKWGYASYYVAMSIKLAIDRFLNKVGIV